MSQILFLGLCTVDSIADVSDVPAISIVKVEVSMVDRLITFLGPGISPSPSSGGLVSVSLKFLMVLASTVILVSEPRRTHDHIFLSPDSD